MNKSRLEAFSDGVLAIIITIMVLEIKAPEDDSFESLLHLIPVFLSYVLSFIYVGIYWNNHHHMFQAVKNINGKVLWANLHLLFWLSLVPFSTGFMGENHFAPIPMAVYAFNLTMCAVAYTVLQFVLVGHHGRDSSFAKALGSDRKGKISLAAFLAAIVLAFVSQWASLALLSAVTLMWFIPDRRFER